MHQPKSRSKTPDPEFRPTKRSRSLNRSSPPRPVEWAWGFPLHVRSSKATVVEYGRRIGAGAARYSGSECRSSGRVSRARAGIGVRRDSGPHKYRLRVPPNVPVEQYWSVTAYDRETHARIREMECASGASNLP